MLHTAICKHTVASVKLSFSGTFFLMTNFWRTDIYVSSIDLCLHMVTDVTPASMVDCKYWQIFYTSNINTRLPQWLKGKEPSYNTGETDSFPGSGWSPGEGHGNPLQYSCLENPMDRGAWWATVHRVTKSQTRLKRLITQLHFYHGSFIFKFTKPYVICYLIL